MRTLSPYFSRSCFGVAAPLAQKGHWKSDHTSTVTFASAGPGCGRLARAAWRPGEVLGLGRHLSPLGALPGRRRAGDGTGTKPDSTRRRAAAADRSASWTDLDVRGMRQPLRERRGRRAGFAAHPISPAAREFSAHAQRRHAGEASRHAPKRASTRPPPRRSGPRTTGTAPPTRARPAPRLLGGVQGAPPHAGRWTPGPRGHQRHQHHEGHRGPGPGPSVPACTRRGTAGAAPGQPGLQRLEAQRRARRACGGRAAPSTRAPASATPALGRTRHSRRRGRPPARPPARRALRPAARPAPLRGRGAHGRPPTCAASRSRSCSRAAVDFVLHLGQGPAHHLGDVLVRQPMVDAQQQRRPPLLAQLPERLRQQPLQLPVQQQVLRRGRRAAPTPPAASFSSESTSRCAPRVRRDSSQTWRAIPSSHEARRVLVAQRPEPPVGPDEGLLGGLVRGGLVPEEVAQEAPHGGRVPLEERAEGGGVPLAGARARRSALPLLGLRGVVLGGKHSQGKQGSHGASVTRAGRWFQGSLPFFSPPVLPQSAPSPPRAETYCSHL